MGTTIGRAFNFAKDFVHCRAGQFQQAFVVDQVFPTRLISSMRQKSPHARGRKTASLRQNHVTVEGSPYPCGKQARISSTEASHTSDRFFVSTYINTEESLYLYGRTPLSMQYVARIRTTEISRGIKTINGPGWFCYAALRMVRKPNIIWATRVPATSG